ncbi:MAG TPA: right-handed parallel beta-helix repeat-containing protein [Planctomycetota bacterium]|nr:right-handed parallel beta-helix repeat-containing protein [Planctomycetota bacterium]
MKISYLLAVASRTLVPLFLCAVSQADVIYVDASGNGQHTTIQSAITAAFDGDVLLVRSGTYAGFTLDNRRLSVIADAGALPKVAGTVVVRNTGAAGIILLAGLEIVPPQSPIPLKGLDFTNNAGHVRVQNCTVRGCEGAQDPGQSSDGGIGASILNSSKVAFVGCSLTGGAGGGAPYNVVLGGKGAHGVVTQGSSVAFYDCQVQGGAGGAADYAWSNARSGDGGDGCRVLDFGILASGCQFKGGVGGSYASTPGDGGDGLVVNAGQAQLIGNTYAAGSGGFAYGGYFGATGVPQSGPGVFHTFPGVARKISGPSLAAESATMQIDVTGDPGDRVWLLQTAAPEFIYFPAYAGMRLISLLSSFTVKPDVVLPPSGTASVLVRTHRIGPGIPQVTQYWQSLVENSAGQLRLGSPLHVAVLNCSDLLPDCNGNASCDSCDLLLGTSIDCDKNGVPDECSVDCNANSIADACDIQIGTSLDHNHNGIPDECEPQTTWHVDANAAPGGNGTLGAPFKTLATAFSAAIASDTILVANGVYQGFGNYDLVLGGGSLKILSTGGAANCIIDCHQQGRAFFSGTGVTAAAIIQGFTIRNGRTMDPHGGGGMAIVHGSPTILSCVFDHCEAFWGGGLCMANSDTEIRGCDFVSCTTTGRGGGLRIDNNTHARVIDCNFVANQAQEGAAIGTDASIARIERCFFQSNTSTSPGGALQFRGGEIFLDQGWIAGNSAPYGGGISSYLAKLHVTNCTIVDNRSTSKGGGAQLLSSNAISMVWRNNILWNNTAPAGSQLFLEYCGLDIDWCDVQGGQAGVLLGTQASLSWGAGNIAADPLFVDPDGPDNNALTIGDNDYRLALASPCLDAGDNTSVAADWFDLDGDGNVTEPVPFDFDGNLRFVDIPSAPNTGNGVSPLVDLGAWERP